MTNLLNRNLQVDPFNLTFIHLWEARGFSSQEIATALHTSQGAIYKILRGERQKVYSEHWEGNKEGVMKAAVKMGKTTPPGLEGDSRGLIDITQENQNGKDNAE